MIAKNSFINTCCEYAYDCENRYDMLLRDEMCDNAIEINTQYGTTIVSGDTLVATGRGLWKRADELYVGDSLKHRIMGKSPITGITQITSLMQMFKIVDTKAGYLIVDEFYIASDL